MEYPNTIEIEFTQEDKDKAGPYVSCTHCLQATALTRMGFKDVSVGGNHAYIGSAAYESPVTYSMIVYEKEYRDEVVGMKITLHRISDPAFSRTVRRMSDRLTS